MVNLEKYFSILSELKNFDATLVAVSKTKPVSDIRELILNGQKIFGENYVQELTEKKKEIADATWHFIGHLQSNKAKDITPFCDLIHGIDSMKLLREVNRAAIKTNKIQNCLLQIHIAEEESKFGFSISEAEELINNNEIEALKNVSVKGLMGMATLTDDENKIRKEFKTLRTLFEKFRSERFSILSMGMTSDYKIALEEGSTMVRIGSAIFGEREK